MYALIILAILIVVITLRRVFRSSRDAEAPGMEDEVNSYHL